ncbi:malate dehydrogenase, cytoplasmic [Pontoporia blainvillei]|uniref:Malate dehydrogenase, cytoplasmic n=1 Tax=Pontoporia blainvillei TaxID=48723 RepID=A0ABX0S4C7_PONBL|nr:malate dehydrogenase, cytoplasmic [Pontoporia blainvillei]
MCAPRPPLRVRPCKPLTASLDTTGAVKKDPCGRRAFARSPRCLSCSATDPSGTPQRPSEPIRVLVTGAAGQIAYSLLYSIGNGSVFGKDQPIILVLLDITPMMGVLDGVLMELQDCALPLLKDVIATDKEEIAFKDLDVAILVGSMPRRDGMERKDLLKANVKIFKCQGAALDKYAKKSVKVIVVGNPANTNCLTASKSAPSIPKENFSCLTRLDHNRAKAQEAIPIC